MLPEAWCRVVVNLDVGEADRRARVCRLAGPGVFDLTPELAGAEVFGRQQIVDIVNDSVAIRQMPNGIWSSLSIAYVDERHELFAIAPERILLLARDAADLKLGRDTTIDGVPTARLTATVDRYAMTIFIRRGDGLLAVSRFRAAQPNDFGLTEWGEMEVETWYSRWARPGSSCSFWRSASWVRRFSSRRQGKRRCLFASTR